MKNSVSRETLFYITNRDNSYTEWSNTTKREHPQSTGRNV